MRILIRVSMRTIKHQLKRILMLYFLLACVVRVCAPVILMVMLYIGGFIVSCAFYLLIASPFIALIGWGVYEVYTYSPQLLESILWGALITFGVVMALIGLFAETPEGIAKAKARQAARQAQNPSADNWTQ